MLDKQEIKQKTRATQYGNQHGGNALRRDTTTSPAFAAGLFCLAPFAAICRRLLAVSYNLLQTARSAYSLASCIACQLSDKVQS